MDNNLFEKKYILTNEYIFFNNSKIYRIKAVRDFANIKTGDIGGYVTSEFNLSHKSNCWVSGNAIISDNALVSDNAKISGHAKISGNTLIKDNVTVCDHAVISGNIIYLIMYLFLIMLKSLVIVD